MILAKSYLLQGVSKMKKRTVERHHNDCEQNYFYIQVAVGLAKLRI